MKTKPTPLTKEQMSPQFIKLVEDVAEWKKSRGELAYHVQEEVKSIIKQERSRIVEELRPHVPKFISKLFMKIINNEALKEL